MRNGPALVPSEADRIYAAGFFDGEGCVGIYERGRDAESYKLALFVSQIVPGPLTWLRDRWGGSIRIEQKSGAFSRRPLFTWSVSARLALVFLQDIRPWLKVKGEQADVAIEFQQGRRRPGPGRWLPQIERAAAAEEGERAKLRLAEVRTA